MKAINLLYRYNYGGAEKVADNYKKVLYELGIDCFNISFSGTNPNTSNDDLIVNSFYSYFSFLFRNISTISFAFIHCNVGLFFVLCLKSIFNIGQCKFFYVQHLEYTSFKRKSIYLLLRIFNINYIEIKSEPYPEAQFLSAECVFNVHNFSVIDLWEKENPIYVNDIAKINSFKDDGNLLLLFVGAAKPGKGLNHLANISRELRGFKHKIIFVGDGPEMSNFKDYVKHLGLTDNFLFLGFRLEPSVFMSCADLLLFTSDSTEVTPMVVIESLNLRLPVLAFNIDSNSRYLSSDCLFSSTDYKSICEYIIRREYILDRCVYNFAYAKKQFSNFLF